MFCLQVESMCVLLIFYETEHFEILMKRMNDVRSKKQTNYWLTPKIHIKIHPCIHSVLQIRELECRQRCSGLLLPARLLQLFCWNTEALQDQPSDKISPACLGLPQGILPVTRPNHLNWLLWIRSSVYILSHQTNDQGYPVSTEEPRHHLVEAFSDCSQLVTTGRGRTDQ